MFLDIVVERNAAIHHATHQVDAATGRIHLGTKLDIGGAGSGAQATVNAIQEQFVVDPFAMVRFLGSPQLVASVLASTCFQYLVTVSLEEIVRIESVLDLLHQSPVTLRFAPGLEIASQRVG